jgi:hypothetical protein
MKNWRTITVNGRKWKWRMTASMAIARDEAANKTVTPSS